MYELLHRIGKRILISKRRKHIRSTLIFMFTRLFLLTAIIFTIQIALILLGTNNIFIPAAHRLIGIIH